MTNVNTGVGISDPTHDLSLTDGSTTLGLIFAGGPRVLQEVPLTPPAQAFQNEQRNWIGGRGRNRFEDDQTGYFDDFFLWSTSDEKLMPSLQWRFCRGLRNNETSLPGDNSNFAWWKLYGNTPASRIARYLSIAFVASASYNADKGYLYIRRRGTPGTLTFELCQNSSGSPGTVLQTVTKTTTNITDTLSVFQLFDWSGTQALTSGTTYHIKIYGAGTDDSSSHWEVLGASDGTSSKYSSDNSSWSSASLSLYYRITDADVARQWRFFTLEGCVYAISQTDARTTDSFVTLGIRGTATAGGTSTLTDSALGMVTNEYAGAWIWIYDGTGETQRRQIVSNTSTQFTVASWDVVPDTTSRFIVYYTDKVVSVTGTPGVSGIFSSPISTGAVAYIPTTPIRRMRVNGNSHDFADDATYAHVLATTLDNNTLKIVAGLWDSGTIKLATVPAWGTNLTFGTTKQINTKDYRITNIINHNNKTYIFKEDGLYTYDGATVERQGSNFSDAPDSNLGVGLAAQNQYLWFSWAHSIERLLGQNIDDMLNYKQGYDGMPIDRRGNCTCIVSAIGWLFFIFDGGTDNYSSIVVWNGMGYHEIFRGWAAGVRIRNAYWQPNINARGRLWFDVGGDLVFMEFPNFAANPLRDTTLNFHHEGAIVTSTYDAHDQNLYKILSLIRVLLQSGSVEIDYQTNSNVGTSTWTVLGTASTTPVTDINLNLGGVLQIRFRFRLQITNSRTPTVLQGWQMDGRMMELNRYQWLCTFKAESDSTTFSDEPDHDPNTLYSQLQTWATQQTKLTMHSTSATADSKAVTISLPSKSVNWIDTGENKWGGTISLALLQVT